MTTNTVSIRCGLLVHGYIRNEYNNHKYYDQFETSLINIILQLLGNIFMIFDVYPSICKSMVSDDGLIFTKDPVEHKDIGSITFGCSYGWNKGTHKISVRNKYKWKGHAIGITNNIQQFAERPAWYGSWTRNQYKEQSYYYNLNGSILVGTHIPFQPGLFKSKNGNDVISIHFDGDNGTLTFLFNDKIIGKGVKVKKNETYYLFISCNSSCKAKFELMNAL